MSGYDFDHSGEAFGVSKRSLSLRQRQVLVCLGIFGPSCAYAIAETLGLTENQVNPVVCRLKQKGVLIHVCDGETPHGVRCSIVDIAEKRVAE